MDRLLNKTLIAALVSCFWLTDMIAQPVTTSHGNTDYKEPESHKRFSKRKNTVAAWQINSLKNGALVVRLRTSHNVIEGLKKDNKNEEAEQFEAEQFLTNQHIMKSYMKHYRFSKLYFIYSSASDSLRKGIRSGIFLDSNMRVNPAITMNEDYYLIAERDYVYNSSIGFIPEDSAMVAREGGNPTREMAIVLKNKYNHQLKGPFPYFVQDKTYTKATAPVPYQVNYNGKTYNVSLNRENTYEKFSSYVQQLDESLRQFHLTNPKPEPGPNYEDAKPFFY